MPDFRDEASLRTEHFGPSLLGWAHIASGLSAVVGIWVFAVAMALEPVGAPLRAIPLLLAAAFTICLARLGRCLALSLTITPEALIALTPGGRRHIPWSHVTAIAGSDRAAVSWLWGSWRGGEMGLRRSRGDRRVRPRADGLTLTLGDDGTPDGYLGIPVVFFSRAGRAAQLIGHHTGIALPDDLEAGLVRSLARSPGAQGLQGVGIAFRSVLGVALLVAAVFVDGGRNASPAMLWAARVMLATLGVCYLANALALVGYLALADKYAGRRG